MNKPKSKNKILKDKLGLIGFPGSSKSHTTKSKCNKTKSKCMIQYDIKIISHLL